ncbi:hypothetical protein L6654_41675 [Bradyrhizobium sp. WYCCWR 13023]|uniref:Uncharacterized protein n=2 Tax=Bradyrhizobium TaxID=374 RepID=A0A9X1RKG3_9BRAD|nr:hypothetical protein [Bradyrhizobium zhengyangense]MCG2633063.1 hypothetical protein [Bradyrhizobium zhengyangense]MCG2668329.1 hypothetical protein [Bradyrhizobium zhengyangense]MDA9524132.1 hypothetical protein [Bradyrhizobium sp. CCBAU 11434]
MFGYCGDVVFPSLVLAQIVSAIDNGVLFRSTADAQEKQDVICEALKTSFTRRNGTPDQDFSILHLMRAGEEESREFYGWEISYAVKARRWHSKSLEVPMTTGVVSLIGSGKPFARKYIDRWVNSDVGNRGSAIFSGFCDSLFSNEDQYSGGMPQVAALNKGSHAQIIGFIEKGRHYLNGLQILPARSLHRIKWTDRYFQDINPTTMQRKTGARRRIRPVGL